MYDILFKNADIITVDDSMKVIRQGCVGVTGKLIAYVGHDAPDGEAKRTIDCRGRILMPGLVNTHAHVPMCVMRGYADDYRLQQWLFEKVMPVEARLDERAVVAGARLGFAEMLRTGTTSVSDMYYFEPAIARIALETGMRASLCNAVVAMGEDYDPERDRSFRETRTLAQEFHGAGGDLVRANVSIHAEYTSSPKIWRLMTDIGHEYGLDMQVHLSETKREHDECVARYGMTPAAMFDKYGVFDLRTVAAHCVWVTDEDMDILAGRTVSAAHNPVSNLKLASGVARVRDMMEHGVNVTLGTDGCCSNNTHDLFEELKLCALLAKERSGDPSALGAYEAIKLATVNGAKAQGREGQTGAIKAGLEADIILLDMDSVLTTPYYDPMSAVVYSTTGERVCLTMVQGRILYENGEFKTIDIEFAKREVREHAVPIVLGE